MVEVIIEHEWKKEDGENVMKVVGGIIEMQKKGTLPPGFALKGVQLLKGRNKAICNWEAPSSSSLSELLAKVNPPTIHTVTEVSRVL
ncbi:MAG: hypothetical protein M1290_04855 [Candidatus Thermoplasmatota archaeon]|nr:hypothetical protein [Candidatus Thermoplasmatota archaeon]MCL5789775.1 hypothetical protein [Candidatus Thermoplasmatota archaeon]